MGSRHTVVRTMLVWGAATSTASAGSDVEYARATASSSMTRSWAPKSDNGGPPKERTVSVQRIGPPLSEVSRTTWRPAWTYKGSTANEPWPNGGVPNGGLGGGVNGELPGKTAVVGFPAPTRDMCTE